MNNHLNRIRRLTHAVILSGALNLFLLALLGYFFIKERPPNPYFELKPIEQKVVSSPVALNFNTTQTIRKFRQLSFEQLKEKLTNTTVVDEGLTHRDLALGCMVAFYHFDLAKALLGESELQKRVIHLGRYTNGKVANIEVYPRLTDTQFQSIIQFANRERWPLTSKGLFLALKGSSEDSSLIDAFSLTAEFLAVEMLFNRAGVTVSKSELLKVIGEGDWSSLSNFAEQQRTLQDLSDTRRQGFLLNYIQRNSKAAALLLLKTDGPFAASQLDDDHVLQILRLVDKKTPEVEHFVHALSNSSRSDLVLQMASKRIEDEHSPLALTRLVTAVNSIPKKVEKPAIETKKESPTPKPLSLAKGKPSLTVQRTRQYVVQEGDSLWKIAKRFHVSIDALKAQNQLDSDFLKPGTTLKIP